MPSFNPATDYTKAFEFSSLRQDWYAANSALPKAVLNCMEGKGPREFRGFPRQWIPVFEWFRVPWTESTPPKEYIPVFSDLSEQQIVQIINRAKAEGSLRIMVESATMYDPILSDFLYILDNHPRNLALATHYDLEEINQATKKSRRRRLILNGWQSYGRPTLKELESEVMKVDARAEVAVALPCALARPYDKSQTHQRIYNILHEAGYEIKQLHRIVVTSLGVLPEEVWNLPQVLAYDAGVPDIYRILRLVRSYFKKNKYIQVLDCLQFQPYSDVLMIAQREGIIQEILNIKIPGGRHFYIRP